MKDHLNHTLDELLASFQYIIPEVVLACGLIIVLIAGLIKRNSWILHIIALATMLSAFAGTASALELETRLIFGGILKTGSTFADGFKLLFSLAGIFTIAMTWRANTQKRLSEYYALILAIILGANFLVMSENLLILFLSLELVSISSYILTAFAFEKRSAEGSLKYFLFGSVASAIMLYGFTILYGIFGTLNFADFQLPTVDVKPLYFLASIFVLAGFLYKVAAAPLHPWAPDVYEAAPMPVVAFFSVVPKIAGVGILLKYARFTSVPNIELELILGGIAILTLTVGNFAALWQKGTKRLMAYSSIGQSGFLLIGIIAGSSQAAEFLIFYSFVYLLLTFLIFLFLQKFEVMGVKTIADFKGTGRLYPIAGVLLLIGMIGLTGLPPTSGFTGKLFLFSALWESYTASGKGILLALAIFGLLNTVVSLFYYLRIPYFAFIRTGEADIKQNNLAFENLLGLILVLAILTLFFSPGLLMGWINKSNFVF